MVKMKKVVISFFAAIALSAGADNRPETWFHLIGGNASKEGLAADIAAVAEAGISGISLFHADGLRARLF